MKGLVSAAALLVAVSTLSAPALAQEKSLTRFTLRPEGRLQLQWDSNALRAPGGRSDTLFKLFAGFSAAYKFETDTTVLGQYQLQLWRFIDQPTFSTLLNVVTLMVSQRIATPWVHSIDPFIAAQLIGKSPTDIRGGVGRTDWNVLTGFNLIQPIDPTSVFIGGYEFDSLQAEVPISRYSSHGLNFAYKQAFAEQFLFSASYRVEYRLANGALFADDTLRNVLGVGVDYYPINYLKVGAFVQYYNDSFTTNRLGTGRSGFDYWVIGLNVNSNLLFGW